MVAIVRNYMIAMCFYLRVSKVGPNFNVNMFLDFLCLG
jgi:hypothetical protein